MPAELEDDEDDVDEDTAKYLETLENGVSAEDFTIVHYVGIAVNDMFSHP